MFQSLKDAYILETALRPAQKELVNKFLQLPDVNNNLPFYAKEKCLPQCFYMISNEKAYFLLVFHSSPVKQETQTHVFIRTVMSGSLET